MSLKYENPGPQVEHGKNVASAGGQVNLTPYTLRPTPYTLHPAPCRKNNPCTLNPEPQAGGAGGRQTHRGDRERLFHHRPGFLYTINHTPLTIHQQPSTINHQPSTINHQPSTLNHQPSAINHQPSTIHHENLKLNTGEYRLDNKP